MPNTRTILIKLISLSLTLTIKPVQILLISKNIKDDIPNKITRYPSDWFRTSNKDKRTISSQFISNFIVINTRE